MATCLFNEAYDDNDFFIVGIKYDNMKNSGVFNKTWIDWIGLALLSILFVLFFHNLIDTKLIDTICFEFLPLKPVTLKVAEAPITIYYEGSVDELFPLLVEEVNEKEDWIYHEGIKGKSWTYLSSNNSDSELTIQAKPDKDFYICFESNGQNGIAEIYVDGNTYTVNTYSNSISTELLRIFPFDNDIGVTIIRIASYSILIILTFIFLFLYSFLAERYVIARYALIVLIAEAYLLYFSVSTSPVYGNYYGGDSAFFILVGKGMKYGYLPYRDFFDSKGPWLFVVEWLGQLISEGRFGAFLLQSINMSGSLIVFDNLMGIGRVHRKIYEIGLLFPIIITAVFSIGGGNLTEEIALFPLAVCLYLGVKYLVGKENEHKPINAGVYGCCFGYLALIRISNAALICAIALTIFISLCVKKLWKNILYNIVAFLIGGLITFVPMLVYFGANGLLREMFSQVFGFGFVYSKAIDNSGWELLFNGNYKDALYPVYVGLVISLVFFKKRKWRIVLLIWLSTIATMASIALGRRNFEHYYGLLIPVIALDVWFVFRLLLEIKSNTVSIGYHKLRRPCITTISILFPLMFFGSFFGTFKLDQEYVIKSVNVDHNYAGDVAIADLTAHIPNDGTVYAWTSQPRWYMYANKFPSFRYCGWQKELIEIDSSIEDAFVDMFLYNSPEWLVLENASNSHPEYIDHCIEIKYSETYNNDYWILYHRIN